MINHWCTTEGKNLKESFIAEMLNAKVGIRFASKAADIVRERQPKFSSSDEWDPNEVLTIKGFNKDIECGVQLYCTLKRLYKKEFDDFEMVEKLVEETAEEASDMMLVKFGWRKEEAKC